MAGQPVTPSCNSAQPDEKPNFLLAPVPEEFLCPLTCAVMEDPLMTRSGLTFERSAILDWLDKKQVCPISGEPLFPSMLVPQASLRIRIRQWKMYAPEWNGAFLLETGEREEATNHHGAGNFVEDMSEIKTMPSDNSWCWDADLESASAGVENIVSDLGGLPKNIVVDCDEEGELKVHENAPAPSVLCGPSY